MRASFPTPLVTEVELAVIHAAAEMEMEDQGKYLLVEVVVEGAANLCGGAVFAES